MKRKGEAQVVDLESMSDPQRKKLLAALAKRAPEQALKIVDRNLKEQTAAQRAKDNRPRKPERKSKARQSGVSLKPANSATEALAQMKRSFGDSWRDDPANPAVELVVSEHHLCARVNTFADGKWQFRRVGDDAVIAIVKLQDGTNETRRFRRGVIDAEWSRS